MRMLAAVRLGDTPSPTMHPDQGCVQHHRLWHCVQSDICKFCSFTRCSIGLRWSMSTSGFRAGTAEFVRGSGAVSGAAGGHGPAAAHSAPMCAVRLAAAAGGQRRIVLPAGLSACIRARAWLKHASKDKVQERTGAVASLVNCTPWPALKAPGATPTHRA